MNNFYKIIVLSIYITFSFNACDKKDNNAPIADAGIDQNIITGSLVILDGSKSSDPDNDTLAYEWSFISKPDSSNATLSDATVVNPTFTADMDGTYIISLVVNDGYSDSQSDTVTITAAVFSLNSPAFSDGETIPKKYACTMKGGNNISPPLAWNTAPKDTVSLVLVVHDPDGDNWIHWLLYGISPQVNSIPEGIPEGATVDESLIFKGAKKTRNTSGTAGYYGPCPPDPPHRYIFTLYALDESIEFTSGASLSVITSAIEGHVLDTAQLVGIY